MGKPKKATPSQRLAAMKPATIEADPTKGPLPLVGVPEANVAKAAPLRLRTKWLVHEKRELPELVDGALRVRWLVHLKAVYEPLSVLHGQATVQGCADNRMFGAGVPEADLVMKLESKAIADSYQVGRAFLQDHVEVQPELRALW